MKNPIDFSKNPTGLLKDPKYMKANTATKQAIFDRYVASTPAFADADEETQNSIRARFGVPLVPGVPERSEGFMYGVPGAVAEGAGNIGPSAAQFGKGLVESISHPIKTAGNVLDLLTGAAYNSLPKAAQDKVREWETNPEALQRAIDAANNFGGIYKQRYGSYDRLLNTVATDPVGFAADASTILSGGAAAASTVGKVARAGQAAERAASIAGVTYNTGRSAAATSRAFRNVARGAESTAQALNTAAKYTNPLSAISPVISATGKIVRNAPTVVSNMLSPKTTAYMTAAEGRAPEIITQLQRPDLQIVPGSMPTAAEAASPLGVTQFSALGEQSSKVLPSNYLARAAEQDAARLEAIRRVGKTPEDLAALQEGRKATAGVNYGAVENIVVSADDTLRSLMQRPSMNKAVQRAKELAAERGVPFQMGPDIKPNTMAGMITEGRPAQYTVQSIHLLKTALGDLVKNPERFGIGATEAGAILKTQKQLVNWLESKVPGYKTARETFAKQSRRINQTEVGQYLEGKLGSPLDETGPNRASTFATAVSDAAGTIKRATTGESRFQNLDQILEPWQVKEIENIKADLAREAKTKTQATQAASTAPKLSKLATESGARLPNLMNRVAAVANTIMSRLGGKLDRKLAIQIATEMLDPQAAAAALQKAVDRTGKAQRMGARGGMIVNASGKALQSKPAFVGAQTQNIQSQGPNRVEFPPFDEEGRPLYAVTEWAPGQWAPGYGLSPAEAAEYERTTGRKYTPPSRVIYDRAY